MDYTNISREELETRLNKLEVAYDKVKERAKKYIGDRQELRLYQACKHRAKRCGMEFNISLEDVVIPTHCPYLGCEITNIMNKGRVDTNASIDRIDSTVGYIKGNIIVISDLANKMKSSSSLEQLIIFARSVIKIHDRSTDN